jgi:Mor family transcriptional regulator
VTGQVTKGLKQPYRVSTKQVYQVLKENNQVKEKKNKKAMVKNFSEGRHKVSLRRDYSSGMNNVGTASGSPRACRLQTRVIDARPASRIDAAHLIFKGCIKCSLTESEARDGG